MSRWFVHYGWNLRRQSRDAVWSIMVGFQVCYVYSHFNFMIRLLVIMFSSLKAFGECESWALKLLSGLLPYLRCVHRALGKRSEAVTVERLLFHMTDLPNYLKINLWQEREAAEEGWENSGCLRGDTCLSGVSVMFDAQREDGRVTLRDSEHPHHLYLPTKTV